MQRTNHLIVAAGNDRGGQAVYAPRVWVERNVLPPDSQLVRGHSIAATAEGGGVSRGLAIARKLLGGAYINSFVG